MLGSSPSSRGAWEDVWGGGQHAADTPTGGTLPQSGLETHIPAKQTKLDFFHHNFSLLVWIRGNFTAVVSVICICCSHLVSTCSNSVAQEPTEVWLSLGSLVKVRFEQLVSRDLVFLQPHGLMWSFECESPTCHTCFRVVTCCCGALRDLKAPLAARLRGIVKAQSMDFLKRRLNKSTR